MQTITSRTTSATTAFRKKSLKTPLAIAIAAASFGLNSVATANTGIEERLAELEARIASAEQRAADAERRAEIAEQNLESAPASSAPAAASRDVEERLAAVERQASGEEGFSFNVYAR
ncbi:MAG: hypothetical protein ACQES7_03375, partial [Pseudomonadota bacterium]